MKAFLWHDIDKVSSNYHERGSVLIEAETIERARELAMVSGSSGWPEKEAGPMEDITREPDAIFESNSNEEKVWVFPDAGCC